MIRFDGYYVTEGLLYDEKRDPINKWYSFTGYLFLEDGRFIRAAKFTKDNNQIDFSCSDFKSENIDYFEVNKDELFFYLNKGKPWESIEHLDRLSSNQFKMQSGRIISYKSWND